MWLDKKPPNPSLSLRVLLTLSKFVIWSPVHCVLSWVLKTTITPSPNPAALANWVHLRSLKWSLTIISVSHVSNPMGQTSSARLHSTTAPQKRVPRVACQFYDPTGLAAPLMFSVRALYSEICRDPQCSINSILSEERSAKFRNAVREILQTREIFFPRQVIFQYQAQLFIFFDGSLQGYGAYMLTPAISSILFLAPLK